MNTFSQPQWGSAAEQAVRTTPPKDQRQSPPDACLIPGRAKYRTTVMHNGRERPRQIRAELGRVHTAGRVPHAGGLSPHERYPYLSSSFVVQGLDHVQPGGALGWIERSH